MKPYEFFDHTADIGVRIHGRTREELFTNAACAFYDVQGRFELADQRVLKIELAADSFAELLVRWLSELVFRLSAEGAVFKYCRLQFPNDRTLVAEIEGGAVNFERSEVFEEIKAVTYHQLSMQETPEGWMAIVIFDV